MTSAPMSLLAEAGPPVMGVLAVLAVGAVFGAWGWYQWRHSDSPHPDRRSTLRGRIHMFGGSGPGAVSLKG